MKKIFLLFASALLSLGAMANVEFTFTRGTGTSATVTAPGELTATMSSTSPSNAWNTGGAMGGRTDVLCPNTNTSATSEGSPITFTLTVSGLPAGQSFTAAEFTHIAVNSGGNLQPSNNQDVRHCNFKLEANGAVVGTLTDQNIWIPAGSTEKVIAFNNALAADAEGNLRLKLTLYKGTSNNGCFYGLTKINLVGEYTVTNPEPDPEEVVHTFSADKVYYIQWKNTGANYITENRDKSLTVADKKNSKYQFWRLIPVEDKSHCYKVQNVVTGNYLGSCNMTPASTSRVSTSETAVEYYIGATAGSGEIASCHYFSSTDCAGYADETAGPRALNKDGASDYIITWQAGTSRTGSYWKIVETTEEYQAPEPPAHTKQTKDLVVYFRPCGMVSNTYLTAAAIDGVDPVSYTATAAPSSFHVPYSKDHGAVMRGETFNVNITLSSDTDPDLKANAYFDWNADGEFEATAAIALDGTAGVASVTVPEGAVSGDTRMRIRLNSNGLDRADDDVEGFVYDIPFAVVGGERKVLVEVNGNDRGTATISANAATYAVGTQLTATATPKGNAKFDSWREGGVVVSREAEYTFNVANRNMTLKAYFTPNTEVNDIVEEVELEKQDSKLIFDLQGRRVANPTKGIYIVDKKKVMY